MKENKKPTALASAAAEKNPAERRAEAKKQKNLLKQQKKEVKRLRKEYEKRRKTIPVNQRPIVCPPDRLGESRGKILWGFLCRAAVIFFAVFGVMFFICDALAFTEDYGITPGYLALWSLIFTAVLTAMRLVRWAWIPGVLALGASITVPFVTAGIRNPIQPFTNIYKAAIFHLSKYYYYDTSGMTVKAPLVRPTILLLTLVLAALYVFCLLRRVRLIPPAIVSAAILWGVFVYNLSRSNWGVTLLIASFSALLVMFVYDRIYIRTPKRGTVDDTVSFFGDSEEPPMPETVLSRKAARDKKREAQKQKKEQKKSLKRARREHTVTVAEELNDYFSEAPKKEKKVREKKPKLSPAEKKAKKAEARAAKAEARRQKREEKRAVRRVIAYRAHIVDAKCAVGGFAGAGMFVLAMIILFLPSFTVNGRFKTIESIDKKMEYYRDYVTALLMGDDPSLDLLAYEGNNANFAPHTAEATPRYFQNVPIMRVDTNTRQYSVYMRGWVGVDYKDGSWHTAAPEDPVFTDYRSLFSTYIDPSEQMFSTFFSLMSPGSIPTDTDYVTRSRSNNTLGFCVSQVNVLRQEFKPLLLYMPSYSLREYAVSGKTSSGKNATFLRAFGSAEPSKITFADYFDGMYTSYRASRDKDGYASVALLTSMKTEGFYRNVADLIANYNLMRYAVNATYTVLGSEVTTITEEISDELLVTLTYTPYVISSVNEKGEEILSRKYMIATDADTGLTYIRVPQPIGTARYIVSENGNIQRKIVDIPENKRFDAEGNEISYSAPALDYIIRYFELLTEAERESLSTSFWFADLYTNYVYDYYTGTDDTKSQVISDLLAEIIANAKTTATEEYEVIGEKINPETGEVVIDPATGLPEMETYTLTRKIQVPNDLSHAADHNTYRTVENYNKKTKETTYTDVFEAAVTDREVYIQRHELVMEIVNYLTNEDNFTYTLRPTKTGTEGLDPVEKFLTETHEGYCVQFASALTLLLREAGIPARYVEGYIATDFRNAPKDYAADYTATVRDSNAHAWVEVWYDGIGWLQYEATPAYYSAMYAVKEDDPIHPINPSGGDEEDDPGEGEGEMTEEELAEYIRKMEEEARRARIRKIILIVSICAAVIALIAVLLFVVYRLAKRAEKHRRALIERIRNAENTAPSREDVRKMSDLIVLLLSQLGVKPAVGEFREDYALRVYKEFSGAIGAPARNEKLTEFEAAHSVIRDTAVVRLFDTIAAEEFGYGADSADLPLLARFFDRLYDNAYRHRVDPFRRVWLWLFRQIL